MRSLLKIRNIFLYKLNINELKLIECRLPIQIEKINNENLSKVLNFRNSNIEIFFRNMLACDDIGIYGILDKKAIAHAWCAINQIAYIHFCNVKGDLRGNNVYPYLLYNLIKIVNETYNIDTFYIDTDNDNIASQNGIEKLGFELYHKYKSISILGCIINKHRIK